MSNPLSKSDRVSTVVWGLVLIGVGAWFLLQSLGFAVPNMGALWPIFPTLVGAGFFIGWLFNTHKRDAAGLAIPGTINLLVGLFFFGFTLGVFSWGDMAYLWPVFPLIVGLSFFVAWVFSLFREWELLIPAGIVGAVGVIGLAFTIGHLDNAYLRLLFNAWPVLLIVIGLATIVRSFARKAMPPSGPVHGEIGAARPETGVEQQWEDIPAGDNVPGGEAEERTYKRKE
ncbi:MAG: hypothetical protein JW934_08355 [Anaerolineae bacterium]|nr:hypothetical protein [Anaerolineae bacterium]